MLTRRPDMGERDALELAIAHIEKIEYHVVTLPFQMLEDRKGVP
jgi:hypothetical protein